MSTAPCIQWADRRCCWNVPHRWRITFSADVNLPGHLPKSCLSSRFWEAPQCCLLRVHPKHSNSICHVEFSQIQYDSWIWIPDFRFPPLSIMCMHGPGRLLSDASLGNTYWKQEGEGGYGGLAFTVYFEEVSKVLFHVPLKCYSAWNCNHEKSPAWLWLIQYSKLSKVFRHNEKNCYMFY